MAKGQPKTRQDDINKMAALERALNDQLTQVGADHAFATLGWKDLSGLYDYLLNAHALAQDLLERLGAKAK